MTLPPPIAFHHYQGQLIYKLTFTLRRTAYAVGNAAGSLIYEPDLSVYHPAPRS